MKALQNVLHLTVFIKPQGFSNQDLNVKHVNTHVKPVMTEMPPIAIVVDMDLKEESTTDTVNAKMVTSKRGKDVSNAKTPASDAQAKPSA